jgi:hypothetical protein
MKRRTKTLTTAAGVPVELADRDALVWHDQDAYRAYMAAAGWSMPSAERMGSAASPGTRRRAAVGGWAVGQGITSELSPTHPDWNALRSMGLG